MLKISPILAVLQSLIDAVSNNQFDEGEDSSNKTRFLSNSSASKKSIGANYLIFSTKKSNHGTK